MPTSQRNSASKMKSVNESSSVTMNEFSRTPSVMIPTIVPSRTSNFARPSSGFQPFRDLPSNSEIHFGSAAAATEPKAKKQVSSQAREGVMMGRTMQLRVRPTQAPGRHCRGMRLAARMSQPPEFHP